MKQYVNFKLYILYLLMFFMPLWRTGDNILLGFLFLFSLYDAKKSGRLNIKNLYPFFLYMFYFCILIVFQNSFELDKKYIILLLPILILPFSLQSFTKGEIIKSYNFFVLGVFIAQIIASFGIVEYYFFSEGKKVALANYNQVNEILRFERPYLGFFSAISLIISYFSYKKSQKWFYIVSSFVSLFIIVIISARLPFLVLLIATIVLLFSKIKSRKFKIIIISTALTGLTLLGFLETPLKHRFQMIKFDARVTIWEGSIKQLNTTEKYIFGIGSQSKISENLLDYYKNEANFEYNPEKQRFVNKNYNTHNQYLNEFIRGGILGLILFLSLILVSFVKLIKKNDIFGFLLLLSVSLFLFVENLLERQMGVYFVSLVLSYAYNNYKYENN